MQIFYDIENRNLDFPPDEDEIVVTQGLARNIDTTLKTHNPNYKLECIRIFINVSVLTKKTLGHLVVGTT